jgi:hypothetical protein
MDAKNPQAISAAVLAQFTGSAQYWRAARQLVDIQLKFAIFLTVAVGLRRRCSGVVAALLQAFPSHGRGHMFDPCITHQLFNQASIRRLFCYAVGKSEEYLPEQA